MLTLSNPKTDKSVPFGYLTAVLHFAPSNLSGYNVCPLATNDCRAACLNTSGQGGIFKGGRKRFDPAQIADMVQTGLLVNTRQSARIARTQLFYRDRSAFWNELRADITRHVKRAKRLGLKPCVRLNGTSDIQWERIIVPDANAPIVDVFPDVQFYDYTKIPFRFGRATPLPKNYHLTFSVSDTTIDPTAQFNDPSINWAVVFRKLPKEWRGREVIDGDVSDLRFLDKPGIVVGLKAKGLAKDIRSKFVVD